MYVQWGQRPDFVGFARHQLHPRCSTQRGEGRVHLTAVPGVTPG